MLIRYHDTISSDVRSYLTLVIAIDLVYLNQIDFCNMFTFLTTRTSTSIKLHRMFYLVGIGRYCCSFNRKMSHLIKVDFLEFAIQKKEKSNAIAL